MPTPRSPALGSTPTWYPTAIPTAKSQVVTIFGNDIQATCREKLRYSVGVGSMAMEYRVTAKPCAAKGSYKVCEEARAVHLRSQSSVRLTPGCLKFLLWFGQK